MTQITAEYIHHCGSDTQYETRVVADNINEIMKELFPVSWEALRMYAE